MSVNFNTFMQTNINAFGKNVVKPDEKRNYTLYNTACVDSVAKCGNAALPYIENYLSQERSENEVFEALCAVDKMADYGTPGLYRIYPVLSKYNDTDSPEIQVMLSGIYRKTLVPDAFGPLCKMLHKQITSPVSKYFDPTEETGGAILEYIRNYGAQSQNPAVFPSWQLSQHNGVQYQVPSAVVISGYLPYSIN